MQSSHESERVMTPRVRRMPISDHHGMDQKMQQMLNDEVTIFLKKVTLTFIFKEKLYFYF
jgi:hypothetical protein